MTSIKGIQYLFYVVVVSFLNQCCVAQPPGCSEKLMNIALYEGSSASFPNIFQGSATQWQVAVSSEALDPLKDITTGSDNTVTDQFVNTYAVDATTLSIFNSTVAPQDPMPYATAGMYMLNNIDQGCSTAAALLVVRIFCPVCTCDDTDQNNRKLLCSVDYAYYTNQNINPIMNWINSSGTTVQWDNLQATATDSPGIQNAVSVLSIGTYDGSTYRCLLTFGAAEFQPDFIATNAPDFTASCSTSCPVPTTTAQTTTANPTTTTTRPTTVPIALNCSGQNLTHIVVYEFSQTSFQKPNDGQPVQWQYTPSSVTFSSLKDITNYDDVVVPAFAGWYTASQSGLAVLNSTAVPQGSNSFSTAGLYILKYRNPNCTTAANLIVIRVGPVCTSNSSSPTTTIFNCSVVFAQSSTQPCNPTFTWTNSAGQQMKQEQPIPKQYVPYVKTAQSLLSVAGTDTSTYQCRLTFSAPSRSPLAYVAPIAPSFNATCSVSRT